MGKHSAPTCKPGQLSLGVRAGLALAVVAVPTVGAGVASGAATSLASSMTSSAVERSADTEVVAWRPVSPPWRLIVHCKNAVWAGLLHKQCSYVRA